MLKPNVVLIDLSQLVLATVMHTYEEGEQLSVSMIRHLILNTIRYNALKFRQDGYTEVYICVDNAKNGYWRRDVAGYYKRNRQKARDQSKWDWEGLFTGLHTVVEELKQNVPFYIIDVDKCEADDGIAVLTKKFSLENRNVMIISSDSDFVQLHKYPCVKQWSPMQKKFVKSKNGSPALDLTIKLLKGDAKDNIASVNVRSDFLSTKVEGERQPPVSSKLVEKISLCSSDEEIKEILSESQFTRYVENRKLIDFDYINKNIENQILACVDEYKLPPKNKLYSYFVKNGLSKLLDKIGEFYG